MRKSYLFMAICFVLGAVMAFGAADVYAGTTGKIQGVVRDAQTGEALPGANVVLEGTKRGRWRQTLFHSLSRSPLEPKAILLQRARLWPLRILLQA